MQTRLGAKVSGRGVKEIGGHKTAIFRQVNRDKLTAHHDALEFPDGQTVLLTFLKEGQHATVLQLPAAAVGPKRPSGWPTFNR